MRKTKNAVVAAVMLFAGVSGATMVFAQDGETQEGTQGHGSMMGGMHGQMMDGQMMEQMHAMMAKCNAMMDGMQQNDAEKS